MSNDLNGLLITQADATGVSYITVPGCRSIVAKAIRLIMSDANKTKVQFVDAYASLPEPGDTTIAYLVPINDDIDAREHNCYVYTNGAYEKINSETYLVYNTALRRLKSLDLNGLVLFKENLVVDYLTKNDSVLVSNMVNDAMRQYHKNTVQFASSYATLPEPGIPGVLYMVPRNLNNPAYTPELDEIWFDFSSFYEVPTEATFYYYIPTSNGSTSVSNNRIASVTLEKNAKNYYVLQTSTLEADMKEHSWFVDSQVHFKVTARIAGYDRTVLIRRPINVINATEAEWKSARPVVGCQQLLNFKGNIVTLTTSGTSDTAVLPIPQIFNGDNSTAITIPSNEIWIDPEGWSDLVICCATATNDTSFVRAKRLPRNSLHYYVINMNDTIFATNFNNQVWFADFKKIANGNIIPNVNYYSGNYFIAGANSTREALWYFAGSNLVADLRVSNGKVIDPYAMLGGKLIKIWANCDSFAKLPLPTYDDINDGKYVCYTYANGSYRQISPNIFSLNDIDLAGITDDELNIKSVNGVSCRAVATALRDKYDVASILDHIDPNSDELMSSAAIYNTLLNYYSYSDLQTVPITAEEIHTIFTTVPPIPLAECRYYRLILTSRPEDGANYLTKIFEQETLTGLTFIRRVSDVRSFSEELEFTEDDTRKLIHVRVTCMNKYPSTISYYPGDLFDPDSDGEYRCASGSMLALTIDINTALAQSTLDRLAFTCFAGKPFQQEVSPTTTLKIYTMGSAGGIEYRPMRSNVDYTPSRVANDGIYNIPFFPVEEPEPESE